MINSFVLFVTAASSCSFVILKPFDSGAEIITGIPPTIFIISAYVTQYGAGRITSSPGLTSALSAA
jgi:hypothetical protein